MDYYFPLQQQSSNVFGVGMFFLLIVIIITGIIGYIIYEIYYKKSNSQISKDNIVPKPNPIIKVNNYLLNLYVFLGFRDCSLPYLKLL
jgi:hypothetical protein